MNHSHVNHDQVCVLTLEGEPTVDDVGDLKQACNTQLNEQMRDFVLDLSKVTTVDSATLEWMLWLQDQAAEVLGQLRLVGLTENVRTILTMTRLSSLLETNTDVDEALHSLQV